MTSTTAHSTPPTRIPLSRERIMQGAIELVDAEGLTALTMRNLAHHLGVEAMSLYHHVANKEALLDGVVDTIVAEIEDSVGIFEGDLGSEGWQHVMRHRILSAREVMLQHQWAPALIETRTRMTPTLIRYMDSLLGIMVAGGFSYDLGHHAMHALGSRALGFNQELFAPDDPDAEGEEDSTTMLADIAPQIPHIVTMLSQISHDPDPDSTLGWCDDQTEFEFGLDLLLDGLEARRLAG